MNLRREDTPSVAAAKASFSTATAYRIESDPRPPSQKQTPRSSRRRDPLEGIFEREVVPLLVECPALRAVTIFEELRRRDPQLPASGVPQQHRTDSLSAAYHNLDQAAADDLTRRYQELCDHYGMRPTRNNRGKAHENGSGEQLLVPRSAVDVGLHDAQVGYRRAQGAQPVTRSPR